MTFVSGSLDGLTGPPTPFALRVRQGGRLAQAALMNSTGDHLVILRSDVSLRHMNNLWPFQDESQALNFKPKFQLCSPHFVSPVELDS